MKKTVKRVFSLLLCVLLLCGTAPAAFAKGTQIVSGVCGGEGDGSNAAWELNTKTGAMTISGTGRMRDFSYLSETPWFGFYESIRTVKIEDGVTSIGKMAFFDCEKLTDVTIADSVTSIGNEAFKSCDGLTAVTIPNGVKSIGEGAFRGCLNLVRVTIPNSVTNISYAAFAECTSLESVSIPNGLRRICGCMFQDCFSLKRVTIPYSVQYIESFAFTGCDGIELVCYAADETGWNLIGSGIGNDALLKAPKQFCWLELSATSLTMYYKQTAVLTASEGVSWSTSDPNVVLVSSSGELTAVSRGTAEVNAYSTTAGLLKTASCTVTVKYAWWQWLIVIFLFGWIWY